MAKATSGKAPGTAGRITAAPSESLTRELRQLDSLGVAELRRLWQRRFRGPPPPLRSGDVLRRLIAWKIQVEAFGDLDAETASKLRQLMRAGRNGGNPAAARAPLRPGAVLVREWRGIEHRVLVRDKGFEHRERHYKSLSEVARAITGTQWSGPRFFGLECGREAPNPQHRCKP